MRRLLAHQARIFPISVPPAHPRQLPRVYFDFAVDKTPLGRVVFELFDNVAPKTVNNFIAFANGVTLDGKKHSYENTKIDRILPFRGLWGGNLGVSIYGKTFPDENYAVKHNKAGILTTANPSINSNDSAFIITLGPTEWLDRKSVGFGEVIHGIEYLNQLERLGSGNGVPKKNVTIARSGEVLGDEYHKYCRVEEFNVWEKHEVHH